jgi:hypothetical protein
MWLAGMLFGVVMVLALAAAGLGGEPARAGVLATLLALLLAITIPSMLRHILATESATGETIIGALDVYVMFGLFFAAVYAAIDAFSPTPFFGSPVHSTSGSYQFFSFVTLTTVGYGNLVPATQVGQSLAILEALLGQIYLVTLVARLVSGFQWGTRRRDLERLAAEKAARAAVESRNRKSDTQPNAVKRGPSDT